MGVGSSRNRQSGVSLNPRVAYIRERARKDGQTLLIDAPVLMKLGDGTVRYRVDLEAEKYEKPHEGAGDLAKKTGYFYHTRLKDFSEDASYNTEEPWKLCYVTKGPNSARQKKLYYVFGKGMNLQKPLPDTGLGPDMPAILKVHGHVYYDVHFLAQSEELRTDSVLDLKTHGESMGSPQEERLELIINKDDSTNNLKDRLSRLLLKSDSKIHLFYQGQELQSTDVVGDLRGHAMRHWKNFKIILEPK